MMEPTKRELKPTLSNYESLVESWVDRGLIDRDALRMSPSKFSSLVMSSVQGHEALTESVAHINMIEESIPSGIADSKLRRGELYVARQNLEKEKADFDQRTNEILNNIDHKWKRLDEEFAKIGAESRLWLRDSLNQVMKHMKELGEMETEIDEIRKCGGEVWAMFGSRDKVSR